MYYIWFDESDKEGAYYSNFYGGILVDSKNYENVLAMSKTFVEEFGITEEIKWQKVNEYWYEKYLTLVDFIFDLLAQGYIKIRIFFRNNQYTAPYLTREQRHKAYPLLYYQFIKHAFGFQYSNPENKPQYLKIMLDDIPLKVRIRRSLRNLSMDSTMIRDFKRLIYIFVSLIFVKLILQNILCCNLWT